MSENESFNWLTKTITLHKTFERKLKMLMLKKRFPKSIVSFRSPVDIVSDSTSLPSFFRWSLKKKHPKWQGSLSRWSSAGMLVIFENIVQSTPNNSNLQGKSKKVRVMGRSSYRELEENSRE